MKNIALLLLLVLCSCSSIKIKELKDDYTQPLIGKVKSIHATIYEYRIAENDTTVWTKSNLMEFDTDNHLIKETKINEDEKTEINYKYTNDLVTEITSPQDKNNYKTVFTYDSNQNCIEEKAFNDNRIFRTTTQIFDAQNNPVEENREFFDGMNHKTKTTYNYNQKTLITEKSMDTLFIGIVKTKMNFNKKGYITRTENLKENTPNNFNQFKIDNAGNLIQKTTHYSDGTIKETFSYQNTYDKKGNIIARKKFYNDKLVGETKFDIVYR
jgi:hypothetical protein